jgi:hypothetical protein
VIARSGHAATPWLDAADLGPQQRMEQVIGHLVDKAGGLMAQIVVRNTEGTLKVDYVIVGDTQRHTA